MNRIFTICIIAALTLLLITKPDAALKAMIESSHEAVTLSVKLLAIYAVWLGILRILEATGIADRVQKLLSPLIKFLFGKDLSADAQKYIAVNMTANLLGVGGAATPMGIKAIESMGGNSMTTASTPMIMLVVINALGLQLLPTTVIGMRSAADSVSSSNIVLPSIIATLLSTALGVVLVKIFAKIFNKPLKIGKKHD